MLVPSLIASIAVPHLLASKLVGEVEEREERGRMSMFMSEVERVGKSVSSCAMHFYVFVISRLLVVDSLTRTEASRIRTDDQDILQNLIVRGSVLANPPSKTLRMEHDSTVYQQVSQEL